MQNLTIALVQLEIIPNNPQKNLDNFANAMKDLQACDLIILPEVFTTGFCSNARQYAERVDGTAYQWMAEQARKLNAVVTGSLVLKEGDAHLIVWFGCDRMPATRITINAIYFVWRVSMNAMRAAANVYWLN